MTKLSFLFLFLFSLKAYSAGLPSHFGNEIGLTYFGYYDTSKSSLETIRYEVDIFSTKKLKESIYITSKGVLGGDNKVGLGFSIFTKLSEYLYVGGNGIFNTQLTFFPDIAFMLSFNYKEHKIEPYGLLDLKKDQFPEVGVRFYYKNKVSLILSYLIIKEKQSFKVGIKVPLHDFKMLDDLLGLFMKTPDLKKIDKLEEELKKHVNKS